MVSRWKLIAWTAVIAVILLPSAILVSMYYADSGRDPKRLAVCGQTVHGPNILQLTPGQCSAIADAVPEAKPHEAHSGKMSSFNPQAVIADVGNAPPADAPIHPLPASVGSQFPSLAGYRYFVVGTDIALIEPSAPRIVAFVEVHTSPR